MIYIIWPIDFLLLDEWLQQQKQRRPCLAVSGKRDGYRKISIAKWLAKLLTEKDSKNTQKAPKGCELLFDEYLKEKYIHVASLWTWHVVVTELNNYFEILEIFWSTNKTIIEFGYRMIWRIMQTSEGVIHLSLLLLTTYVVFFVVCLLLMST